jgi:tetratricopeptide (TPR) repeat protein
MLLLDPARSTAACLATALLLAARAAGAQAPARDPVAAEALFRAGRELVAAGRYAEGCPKFEASFALDPSAGTLLNIAKCHEHDGAIATAWETYSRALVLSREIPAAERRKGIVAAATKEIAALEPRLPKLRIVITAVPLLEVKRDGKVLPPAALTEALPADPGKHEVSAGAPGYRAETRSVTLEEGKTTTVEIALVPEAKSEPSPASGPVPVPVWAWATGAVGLALAGTSVYFLADDLSAIHALRANCQTNPKGTFCAPGYDVARDNARKNRDAPLFGALGGAGVVAIGAAIVGIVRRPTSTAPGATGRVEIAPWVGAARPGAGPAVLGVSARGAF